MDYKDVINGKRINKRYDEFELDIPEIHIPEGYATALIGENGAGKTTLLNILSGLRKDFSGEVRYFENNNQIEDEGIRERIGYTGTNNYFLPHWNGEQVRSLANMLFDGFSKDKFDSICKDLNIDGSIFGKKGKMISKLSDGNQMKLALATVFARETDILILDEPASPLDPLMRDILSDMFRSYLNDGVGKRSILFSTHNISDMENVTDYIILIDNGKILEEGFVTDIKEKYVLVKGDVEQSDKLTKNFVSYHINEYGFEGLIMSKDVELFSGKNYVFETPSLFQICVALLKANTKLKTPNI